MGNSEGPKAKSIPSWQLQETAAPEPSEEDSAKETEKRANNASDSRPSLLESASKFLEDEDIRDAPVERKKFFLGSKGLTEDEIQDLLQEQKQAHEQEQHAPEVEVMEDYGIEKEAQGLQASKMAPALEGESSDKITPSSPSPSKAMPAAEGKQAQSTTAPRDVPPIITYPEFLLHSQKPPPLITGRRLLTTLYAVSGVATAIYGTSKYVVEPMIESLTSARQSLAETASNNLSTLNSKLESTVSKTPDLNANGEADSEIESTDSDPSRFFNRSAGTQTSPQRSRSMSSTTSEALSPTSHNQNHDIPLSEILIKLNEIQTVDDTTPVIDSISDLKKFLDNLPQANAPQQSGKLWEKAPLDEYGKLKAEIRGVKGVLLSARNFPSGVSVR